MYDDVIVWRYKTLLKSNGDRRRVNQVWQAKNPEEINYLYARIGSRKNSVIVTLAYQPAEWNRPELWIELNHADVL